MQIRKDTIPLKQVISPQTVAAEATVNGGWLEVGRFDAVQTILLGGPLDGCAVALTFQQADNADGDNPTTLSAWTGGTLSADDTQVVVDNDPAKLTAGKTHARPVLTVDDGGSEVRVALLMLGLAPHSIDPALPESVAAVAETPAGP